MWSSQWLRLKMSFLYVCLLMLFCSYLSSSGCCGNSSTCLTPDRCTVWIEEDPWWGKTTKSHHQISREICAHTIFLSHDRVYAQKQFDILTVVLFWHGSLSLLSFCFYKPAIKWANLQSYSLREEPLAVELTLRDLQDIYYDSSSPLLSKCIHSSAECFSEPVDHNEASSLSDYITLHPYTPHVFNNRPTQRHPNQFQQ